MNKQFANYCISLKWKCNFMDFLRSGTKVNLEISDILHRLLFTNECKNSVQGLLV